MKTPHPSFPEVWMCHLLQRKRLAHPPCRGREGRRRFPAWTLHVKAKKPCDLRRRPLRREGVFISVWSYHLQTVKFQVYFFTGDDLSLYWKHVIRLKNLCQRLSLRIVMFWCRPSSSAYPPNNNCTSSAGRRDTNGKGKWGPLSFQPNCLLITPTCKQPSFNSVYRWCWQYFLTSRFPLTWKMTQTACFLFSTTVNWKLRQNEVKDINLVSLCQICRLFFFFII